jgi:hypothetical protein
MEIKTKQTAVEWLESEISKFNTVITKEYLFMLIEQAKEMEKQQIEDAFYATELDEFGDEITFQQYYNQTFNR